MARPEIKEDRREQILDAFETCVARYGLEGATLGKTAEIAGLARPLIRHNVGNREDLQQALVDRFLSQSRQSMENLIAFLPGQNRLKAMIDMLFDPRYANPKLVRVFNALSAAAPDDKELADRLQQWLQDFVLRLENVIRQDYPEVSDRRISAVAAGLSGIYFNVEALYPIGDLGAYGEASREAALILADALEQR
ncbi:MAG: TetR/AcrR family transcriptional regulator [Roseibium sp.]|uniref:TetR/AcrR family transcriptional regulator n=1 Tax=Roseibium sp. TaxID=1936156 RepID=UPI001B16B698|nr:TetR/AcrR family transcriptional regulator [Roseibium sp.]MBO6893852.1 TetR/AcrR family transcriptional regulator [Roseibium sp.]MBO6932532.1 TetR/AcrR family transcriptional regulator [Roseibium sp.]